MSSHDEFMGRCLDLARKGEGRVEPNPMVGAVVVRNGRVVSTGFHPRYGGPHAEAVALKKAGARAKGATLYVNLEPCSAHHHKKTPPCADEVVRCGIREAVVAMKDPNPSVNGKGFRTLRRGKVRLRTGVREAEARELNAAFIKYQTKRLPYVIAKWAMTLDGKIATATGDSKWITSAKARNFVKKELRSRVQAVLVGSGTALRDDPMLSAAKGEPARIILDSWAQLSPKSNVVRTAGRQRTIVAVSTSAPEERVRALGKSGCEVVKLEVMDLKVLFEVLAGEGIHKILIEGGSEVHASAMEQGLVDEIWAFIAPKIAGGVDAKTPVGGSGVTKIAHSLAVESMTIDRIGPDLLIRGKIGS